MTDPDSVDDVLGADHADLGVVLSELLGAVESCSAVTSEVLKRFSQGLLHHMDWEEKTLFPRVREHATAAQKRSIESLEIDHERLRETLDALGSALTGGDPETAIRKARWLATLLQGHNYDEEHGVYVEADRYLGVEDRRRIIAEFRPDRK